MVEVATDPRSSMGPPPQEPQKCPRCDSFNTRFCYYANKNPSQPRYHCKSCRRYWTSGGIIRDIPIGGGSRKSNPSKCQPSSNNTNSTRSTSISGNCIDAPLGPPFMVTNFNPLVGISNITNSTKSTSNSSNHIDAPLGPPFTVTKFNPVVEIGSSTSLMTTPNSMVLDYKFGNLTAMQKTLDVQQENQQQQQMTVGKIDMKELTAELEKMVSLLLEEVGEVHSNSELLALDLCSNGSQGLSDRCQLGAVIRRAEMYQEYMKQIPIPPHRGSLIPFTTWQGLAKSVKKLYGQPLHYLTNILLKQWDEMRIGTYDEHQPLDTIIHPCKAEATIWLIEEVHRLASSHYHLATLWASDPMHHTSVDPIFPQI